MGHGFVNYDDDEYVVQNAAVRDGLTRQGIVWAFTTFEAANWHPLTWLSHMLDVEIFGLWAGGHRLTSLLLHLASTLLLFHVLRRMTGASWRPAFVAAIFALHPLHVESVAWVAERKDVLSTFFGMLAVLAYARYVERPDGVRYALVVGAFTLGLMAKPMLVTLPFLLLLLDYWPLGRLAPAAGGAAARAVDWRRLPPLLLEKAPMLVLSAFSSWITLVAQGRGKALAPVEAVPFGLRVANALVSYVRYLGKSVWPAGMAVFYPHPGQWPWPAVAGSVVVLAALTLLALLLRSRRPYLVTGWLWYLGTLFPVIGLVQVGSQALADRYTYLPLIGPAIALAWGASDWIGQRRIARVLGAAAAVSACLALGVIAWRQVGFWKSADALFEHAIAVTRDNGEAHYNLGIARLRSDRDEEAAAEFRKAIEIQPRDPRAHNNLGTAYHRLGRLDDAIAEYRATLAIDPGHRNARKNLALALSSEGRDREAADELRLVLRDEPLWGGGHRLLGLSLVRMGALAEGEEQLREAVRLEPGSAEALSDLGACLSTEGKLDDAIAAFREALRLDPGHAEARRNLDLALKQAGGAATQR